MVSSTLLRELQKRIASVLSTGSSLSIDQPSQKGSSILDGLSALGGLLGKGMRPGGVKNRADDISILVLDKLKNNSEKSFRDQLFEFIDQSGHSDPDIYKRAWCSRQLFNKIKNQKNYHASKDLVITFCLALELEKEKAKCLLLSAGYALSNSDPRDIAFDFCIDRGIYDIAEVNEILEGIDKKPLRYTD